MKSRLSHARPQSLRNQSFGHGTATVERSSNRERSTSILQGDL
jgi:hypothetical protein